MRILVLAVGRARAPFADDAAHYERLLARRARVEVVEVDAPGQVVRRVPERAFVCVLDQRGEQLDSPAFSRFLEERRQAGRDVAFLLGGPFGHELGDLAVDRRLSLGSLTLPHQLARVVLLEQLFRAHKILAGEAYHH